MGEAGRALRDSLRGLRRQPGPALAAVAILAVGLSAGVAAFTYVDGFRQPFPGVEADGLVRIFDAGAQEPYRNLSYPDYLDYAGAELPFDGFAATQPFYAASVRFEDRTEVAYLEAVSGSYFRVLGVKTRLGRGLAEADDRPGAPAAAVLSHAWWLRSFGGRESVIGQTVYLNFRPFTVVGVAAPDFLGTTSAVRPDVWIPFAPFGARYTRWATWSEDRDRPLVHVYAQVRGSASAAAAAIATTARGLDRVHPRKNGEPRRVHLEAATWIDPSARLQEGPTVRLMVVAAAVLLLLVCANAANLLLALASGRQRDMAVRSALGASPGRLVRQVLIESLLLSGLAGALALAAARPLASRLGSYFARPGVWAENVTREISVRPEVAAFALAISLLTGLVAGLLPALRAGRRDLVDTLRSDAGTLAAAGGHRWRWLPGPNDLLVAAQVGLSLVLLVVAGLVGQTFASVQRLDPGFDYQRLLVTHVSTSSTTLEPAEREGFFRNLADRLGEQPWVSAATVVDFPLLSGHPEAQMRLQGRPEPVTVVYSMVVPGFFQALGIPVTQGRAFLPGDRRDAPAVAIVNETLSRRHFEGRAIGQRVWWPDPGDGRERAFEIVGVVRDTRTRDYFGAVEPTVYFSYPQHPYPTGSALVVSAKGDPASAVPALQRWLREFEPHLAIVNVVTYRDIVRGFVYTQRMNAEMFTVLALLGTALAALGIFSVLALAVGRRTREIGIRLSVGASRVDIARLVLGQSLLPVGIGAALGVAGSFVVGRLLGSLLHGIEPGDPMTLVAATALLVVAALAAVAGPARRATAVDPVVALRHE